MVRTRLAALSSLALLLPSACTVQKSDPVKAGTGISATDGTVAVDPAQVPVVASCPTGQYVAKTDTGWECKAVPASTVDYKAFGACEGTQKVVGIDPATGAVQCADAVDPTQVPVVASCPTGQYVAKTDTGWECKAVPASTVDYKAFGACSGTQKVAGVDSTTGAVQCAADVDTDTTYGAAGGVKLDGTTFSMVAAGLKCNGTDKVAGFAADGTLTCSADLTGSGTSQWQDAGSDIYFSAGKVGIGTATPTTQLEISRDEAGSANQVLARNTNAAGSSSVIVLNSAAGANDYVQLFTFGAGMAGSFGGTGISNASLRGVIADTAGPAAPLVIGTWGAEPLHLGTHLVGRPVAMTLDTTGKVGIGTTTPGALLDVKSEAQTAVSIAKFLAPGITGGQWTDVVVGKSTSKEAVTLGWANDPTNPFGYVTVAGDSLSSGLTVRPGGRIGIGNVSVPSTTNAKLVIDNTVGTGNGLYIIATDGVGSGMPVQISGNTTGKTFGTQTYGRLLRLEDQRSGAGFYDLGIDASGSLFVTGNNKVTAALVLDKSGNVGLGTVSPASRLDLGGGCMTGSSCSDARLKTGIAPLDTPVLERVSRLRAATFEWKSRRDGKRHLGLIAQDVEKVFPEVVTVAADGSNMGLECTGLNAIAIEAVKELKRDNDDLRRENLRLAERLDRLEAALTRR